jgi:uncharacterized membrane protein
MKENSELRAMSIEALKDRWGLAIGGFLIYNIILILLQNIPIAGSLASLIIGGPFLLGATFFSLNLARKQDTRVEVLFEGFKDFGRALGTYLLMILYIILWTLLLVIPGIIKAISYSQTFYILAEDKSIGAEEAIKKSLTMMDGYKMKYFVLGLSFIGWILLSILTLGIGFLWLIPYMQVTFANFHIELKENYNRDEPVQ